MGGGRGWAGRIKGKREGSSNWRENLSVRLAFINRDLLAKKERNREGGGEAR